MAVQIGKYRRPGIFVEEFDQSIIISPTTENVNALVVGFSKKGPVNTPIRLTNMADMEAIYGPIDRSLERKGSFFHRTISKLLESTSVFAVNLLATDDTLDTVDYVSLSGATNKSNGLVESDSYRKIFDTTGFWKRSTDDFLNMVSDDAAYNDTILHITNVSDRPISVFIFKSMMTGFDRTLIEWYGTAERVPSYLKTNDWASDYMVDVVVVGGDWSNYPVLSVDPRWSRYFDVNGLKKSMVREFANDRNVKLLAYYEGTSLIPYFRDGNGRNIFIENIINNDTDKTGLFCVFNVDLFETDYPMGMVDLIGNNLVDTETKSIDFLSYKGNIIEQVKYDKKALDSAGNTLALIDGFDSEFRPVSPTDDMRTTFYADGYVSGVSFASASFTASQASISYNIDTDAYAVIGTSVVSLSGASSSFTIPATSFPLGTTGASYSGVVVVDTQGVIKTVISAIKDVYPRVAVTDIPLTSFQVFKNSSGNLTNITSSSIAVGLSGFNDLSFGTTASIHDYGVNISGSSITYTFFNTATSGDVTNYKQYRRIKAFNGFYNLLNSPNKDKMAMVVDSSTYEKISLEGVTASNFVTSSLSNKSFTLTIPGLTGYGDLADGLLVMYKQDDEFIIGEQGGVTKNEPWDSDEGVIGRQSQFYLDYLNGTINSFDYLYTNLVDREQNDKFNVSFVTYQEDPYIVLKTLTGVSAQGAWPNSGSVTSGQKLVLPSSNLNTSQLQILTSNNVADEILDINGATYGNGTGSDGVYVFELNNDVVSETLSSIDAIYDYDLKHYLKMYIDTEDKLNLQFVTEEGLSNPLTNDELTVNKFSFDVNSNLVNYKQTVEVVYPAGYTSAPNKVLVQASRYTELRVGDYLKAYVDTENLQAGEVPRKLTRVLSKRVYAADTTLVEISCDARIDVVNRGTEVEPEWQTTRYTVLEDYFDYYKAIPLQGFKMRQASMPDGTEARQNEILNVVAKGTPLFNALVNKEAIDIRYVVDAFGLGLSEKSKQQLVDICGDRLDCFGFINMPSLKQFRTSTNPSFVNANGVLDTAYIAQGGNPESNPSFLYSFGDGPGSTCAGYFLPYVEIKDNGRPLELPPAMFVAATYLRKHNSNITSLVPWTIAAGVTNGRVTGFDKTEAQFTLLDIENLNQAQMNPIVFKRNRGHVIETENTAQVLFKSSLSYIHVREVLIQLERELSRMLLDFQWKFNTPEIRAEIKLRADVICEQYINLNGLYNYFNKCDEENNTTELISRQIGVLDTYVEPILGMGIIVNNITILRTGSIQSGGFIIP
jgi:hypothetical protein